MSVYKYMSVCIYACEYIQREREKERKKERSRVCFITIFDHFMDPCTPTFRTRNLLQSIWENFELSILSIGFEQDCWRPVMWQWGYASMCTYNVHVYIYIEREKEGRGGEKQGMFNM